VRGKDVSRAYVEDRYHLVKTHDRVGRMADSWEYSDVPFPVDRLDPALLAELRATAPSLVDDEGDRVVIRHLYIERRMVPLNLYLEEAGEEERVHAIREYGQAIKDMVAANIFPGDMLFKNFGMTRQGRVVFYDYDEIEYLTDCNFRRVPEPRTEEQELSGEVWYPVARNDIFPETFEPFLLGDPRVRAAFMKHHADLLDAAAWQHAQARVNRGELIDFYPYDPRRRLGRSGTQGDPEQRPSASGLPLAEAAPVPAGPTAGSVRHSS